MEITTQMVRDLCALSKLAVSEENLPVWQSDLQKMVGLVEQLQRVDTRGVEPLLHLGNSDQVLREDKVEGSVSLELALQQAPAAIAPYFSVPTVINQSNARNQEN
ncbi:MAG: Asp-tRNA(Asn)/Glu-tRNA(Gln) amidotransferase subunit GatC [Sediminibacterium sp.]